MSRTIARSATTISPRWRRPPRVPVRLRRATAHLNLAVAEHILHFSSAAIEALAGPQAGASAALADVDGDAAGADTRRLGSGFRQRLAVDEDGGLAVFAAHVAVEARGGRGDHRCAGPIGQASAAAGVEGLALLGRVEKAPERLLRRAGCAEQAENEERREPCHDFAARSMIVMRSMLHSARRRAPIAAL